MRRCGYSVDASMRSMRGGWCELPAPVGEPACCWDRDRPARVFGRAAAFAGCAGMTGGDALCLGVFAVPPWGLPVRGVETKPREQEAWRPAPRV